MSSATLDDSDMKDLVTPTKPNGHAENPYLSARRQWNSDVERAFHSARLAWAVAFACLFITVLAVGGLLYYAGQPRLVPYVVAIDPHGQTFPLRPADRANALEGLAVRSYLADWIRCARQITPHIPLQQQAIDKVFSMLRMKDPAKRKVDAWWNPEKKDRYPFSRAETQSVDVQVETPQPLTTSRGGDLGTWQVIWLETVRDLDGAVKEGPTRYRATLQVYTVPETQPRDEADLLANPLGLYIQDFDWQPAIN